MATNARNDDRSTSHATDPAFEKAADFAKVKNIHLHFIKRGLTDFELDDCCGGHMNGRWRKRRSDLTLGSAARCEKILCAAEDCSSWIGDRQRRNPNTSKSQKVWIIRPEVEIHRALVLDDKLQPTGEPFASFR